MKGPGGPNGGPRRYAVDPSSRLETVFREIERTRMAGLPLLNNKLAVAAVGFAPWQGNWLGALITPWFLNLLIVPGETGEWRHAAEGESVVWTLPAGDCAFYGNFEPAIGEYHSSSICSPMSRFPDQAAARAEALSRLDFWTSAPAPNEQEAGAADEQRRAFLRRVILPGDR